MDLEHLYVDFTRRLFLTFLFTFTFTHLPNSVKRLVYVFSFRFDSILTQLYCVYMSLLFMVTKWGCLGISGHMIYMAIHCNWSDRCLSIYSDVSRTDHLYFRDHSRGVLMREMLFGVKKN